MKKRVFIILMSVLIIFSSALFTSCKSCSGDKDKFYSLTLNAGIGGTLAKSLESGLMDAGGSYSYDSVIKVTATADKGYKLAKLTVNGGEVEGNSYSVRITGNSEVRAVFERKYSAAAALERMESAFLNTYDLSGYDEADGVKVTANMEMALSGGMKYPMSVNFSYAKNTSESYFGLDLKVDIIGFSLTAVSLCYFDSSIADDGRLYIAVLDLNSILEMAANNPLEFALAASNGSLPTSKYYVKTATLTSVRDLLNTEMPYEGEVALETNSTLDLLEELGYLYDIENNDTYTSLSVDVTAVLNIISLLFDSELSPIDAGSLPQMDFTLRVDYSKVNGVEKIKPEGIAFVFIIGGFNDITELSIELGFTIKSMELQTWKGTAPTSSYDKNGATEADISQILEALISILGLFE